MNAGAHKVLVLTEGVVGYLPNDAVAALAADLAAQPRFAWWVVEYVSPQFRKIERIISRRRRKQLARAPLQFHPDDWLGFFAARGWRPREIRYLLPEAERLGRKPPVPWWMRLVVRIVTLNDPSVLRNNIGFALMERRSGAG